MDDKQIVELYWNRDERAISETEAKYGHYLQSIALQVLSDNEDAAECVNDTYLAAWNSIPPHRPELLSAYLGKIVRRISIDLWRKNTALKRGRGRIGSISDELKEHLADTVGLDSEAERLELRNLINTFLSELPVFERQIFVCRYWYMDSIAEIAANHHSSESRIKTILYRTRKKLRKRMTMEGYYHEK